jgi:hypothetical protein
VTGPRDLLTRSLADPHGSYEQRKATTSGPAEHQEGGHDGATEKDHLEVAKESSNGARETRKQGQKAASGASELTTIETSALASCLYAQAPEDVVVDEVLYRRLWCMTNFRASHEKPVGVCDDGDLRCRGRIARPGAGRTG